MAEEKKKSKKKVIIIIIIIVIVVFFILPPALTFILLFDGSKMKVNYDENFSVEKWSESLIVNSLDETETNEVIKFSVSENDINNALYSGYKDNQELKEFVDQIAIDIKQNSYTLSLSAKLGFFKTRIKVSAQLEKKPIEDEGVEKEAYVFTLKSASIGRLGNLKSAVMSILKSNLGDSDSASSDLGVKIHTDFDNSRIYIFASDLRKIIDDALSSGEGDSSNFYLSFINDFLDKNLVDVDFYGNDSLTFNVRLHDLTGNDYGTGQYVYYGVPYGSTTTKLTINGEQKSLSLNVIRDAIVSLLNDGLINENQMDDVSEYLFNGYNGSNAPSCSLTSIGINNKETYQGFNLNSGVSLDDIVSNGVASFSAYDVSLNSFELASFTESDVNAYLKAQKLLGNKFFLTGKLEDNSYKANYIALDNAYINFTNDSAIMSIGLNINGLETIMTIPMSLEETSDAKLVYSIDDLYYGASNGAERFSASESTKQFIFKTLHTMASNDSFSFSEDGKMTIDFSQVINQSTSGIADGPYKTFLDNNARFSVSVDGANVSDNAVIKIKADRN